MQENISESFKYYDNSLKKYKKYYKDNNNELKKDFINNLPTFELKNDNKILMSGEYNFIGLYGDENGKKYFRWGWDMIFTHQIDTKNNSIDTNNINEININKNNTYYIKKIINYIFDLKINVNDSKELFYYEDIKNLFLHYMIEIKNPLQFEILLAMTLLITKSDLIWREKIGQYTRYYLLKNVKEL